MTTRDKRPQAFRLDDPGLVVEAADLSPERDVVLVGEGTGEGALVPVVAPPKRRGMRWGAVFWSALGTLVSLAIGLSIDALVRDLFARNDWLGWIGIAATILLVVALAAIALREVTSLLRLRRIEGLREAAAASLAADDARAARQVTGELVVLYAARPETARARTALKAHLGEVIDASDLLHLAERELLRGLDLRARRLVMDSSRRVSLVTAVSPRALLDIAFVLAESLRLIRRLSTLYGGRPGVLGLLRLAREVMAHLAVTGGMALGEGLVQQIVGHGVAARLSARLGEGVINGLLTARIGLAAIEVCRPLPFLKAPPVSLKDVMAELVRISDLQKT